MTLTHILCTGAMIAAGIVALVAIVVSFREEWTRVRVVLGFQPAAPIKPSSPSPAEERGRTNGEVSA
ncbi:hypothetical protein [Rhizorhabdus wittichii]|uniref:hypothetical protein n=1 Tax=Rhizorhabdus wittichii TaxID=160791 RepID=UPI0002E29BB1|nr:hypothetical protein [Rhizorhabdus wittichii]